MEQNAQQLWFLFWIAVIPGALGVLVVAVYGATCLPGLWRSTDRFNSARGWTPAAPHEQQRFPREMMGLERGLAIITPHLEDGEILEGLAFADYWPPRPQDWGYTRGPSKNPVLIAVTPTRMLLFQLKSYPQIVLGYCFVRYDAIQFLHPPKRAPFGLSGRLRFGLRSGLEYQLRFLGPLPFPEFLQQEQRLAAYLRWLAPRLPSTGERHALEARLAP